MKFLSFICLFALLCFTLAGGAYKENVPYGYYDADGSSVPHRDISANDNNNFDYGEGQKKNQHDSVNQMANQLASFMNNNVAKDNRRKKDSLLNTNNAHKRNQQRNQNAIKKNQAYQLNNNEHRKRNNMNFQKNNQNFEDLNNFVNFRNNNNNLDQNQSNRSNKNRAQKQYFDNTKKRSSAAHQTATNAFDQDSGFGFKGLNGFAGYAAPSHTSKYGHKQNHKFGNEFDDSQNLKKAAESYNNANNKNLRKRINGQQFDMKNSKKRGNKNSVKAYKNNDSYNKNNRANKINQLAQMNLVDRLSSNDLVKVLQKLSTSQLSKLLAAKKNQLQRKNARANASHGFGQNRNLAKDLGNKSYARKD